MKRNRFFVLAMLGEVAIVAALGAQTFPKEPIPAPIGSPLSTTGGEVVDLNVLPVSRGLYLPSSGVSRATVGAIGTDADNVVSVFNFSDMAASKSYGFVGVDATFLNGLNVGYGTKVGKNSFIGVAYGGSLLNELAMMLTNHNVIGMQKKDTIETNSVGENVTKSRLEDASGNELPVGVSTSDNTLSFLYGVGAFGLRVSFNEFLQGTKWQEADYEETTYESSLKPTIEFGFNLGKGKVRYKPGLSIGLDIHQYNYTGNWINSPPTNPDTILKKSQDFTELSATLNVLTFDFNHSAHTRAEMAVPLGLAYRAYTENGKYGTSSEFSNGIPTSPYTEGYKAEGADSIDMGAFFAGMGPMFQNAFAGGNSTSVDVPAAGIRISFDPQFTFRRDITKKVTLGVRAKVAIADDVFAVHQKVTTTGTPSNRPAGWGTAPSGETDTVRTTWTIVPDLSVGAVFNLLPDHFALFGGLNIQVLSIDNTVTKVTYVAGNTETNVESILGVPTVGLALGLSVNFTRDMALELLALAANVADIGETGKFNILFSFKK